MAAALCLALPLSAPMASADAPLVKYTTKSHKIRAAKKITFGIVCSVDCSVRVKMTLVWPGKDIGPVLIPKSSKPPAQLSAGVPQKPYLTLTKQGKNHLKANVDSSKLQTKITAFDPASSTKLVIRRTFHFYN